MSLLILTTFCPNSFEDLHLRLNIDGKNLSAEVIRTDSTTIDYFEILKEPHTPVPETFNLSQNFPNPFNPSTTIRYSVPDEAYVTLRVYDALGALVATLVDEQKPPGIYEVVFNINTAKKLLFRVGFTCIDSAPEIILNQKN